MISEFSSNVEPSMVCEYKRKMFPLLKLEGRLKKIT